MGNMKLLAACAAALGLTVFSINDSLAAQRGNSKLGQRDEALAALQKAIDAGPSSADSQYGTAVVHALLGDAQVALPALEKALALGTSASLAKDDEDLASLRALPRFRELLEAASAAPARR